MKTNKSYTKRFRVTKTGKILSRKAGGNHFNAKESRSKQMNRARPQRVSMNQHTRRRFLPNT